MADVAFPIWAVFALGAALATSCTPLIQERFRADGFALAFWNKIIMTLIGIPMILYAGFPTDPLYYLYVGVTAVIFCVSDVIYFRAVSVIGAGLMTRLLPSAVIITFLLWFAVDPALIRTYWAAPWKVAAIAAILCAFVFFATRVKQCAVSWAGIKIVWPVISAACVGPIFLKLALARSGISPEQNIYAFIFVQSAMMTALFALYQAIKGPITRAMFTSTNTIFAAAALGLAISCALFLKMSALQGVDNPAFVTMILFTDVLWVQLVYRILKRREQGNLWAGFGIVACAALLVLVKAL